MEFPNYGNQTNKLLPQSHTTIPLWKLKNTTRLTIRYQIEFYHKINYKITTKQLMLKVEMHSLTFKIERRD